MVDLDLEKFFERVKHAVRMVRWVRRISAKRGLGGLRRYLQAGLLTGGVVRQRVAGTPPGGPLSPLRSNVRLHELDQELEQRGDQCGRYAAAGHLYGRGREAGERVLKPVTRFLSARLRWQVNAEKSAVARPWERKFLGYSLTWHKQPRLTGAPEASRRRKAKVRTLFRAGRGRSLPPVSKDLHQRLRGWLPSCRLAEVNGVFEERAGWLRRKPRGLRWRPGKRPRTRMKELMNRGLEKLRAWKSSVKGAGAWWNAGAAHLNEAFRKSSFERLGLIALLAQLRKRQFSICTAGCGTARPVVWEDGSREAPSYPMRRPHGLNFALPAMSG
jgi:RNA-directed DNA polymerase